MASPHAPSYQSFLRLVVLTGEHILLAAGLLVALLVDYCISNW